MCRCACFPLRWCVMVRVRVTAQDIKRGRRSSFNRCPIARAVHRLTYKGARVDVDYVTYRSEEYSLPLSAKRFISEFDEPISTSEWDLNDPNEKKEFQKQKRNYKKVVR